MTLASGIQVSPERVAEICQRYRIVELAVFGSAARGDMRPGSDIDIYLEFEAGTHPGMGYFDLEDELSALFGKPVDLGRKSLLKPLVRRNAVRDAVVLYAA
ncbi:MAG: nucleotidyltransferase family protein [Bryobacterales bacterium]|nr:nucleotidyltransferase family protein [Bryobacterales bacterium]